MKPARLAVLGIAIAAGGAAAYLASRSEAPPPVTVGLAPPQAPADTVDILVAKKEIGKGQSLLPQDVGWVAWPASASNPAYVRRADRPDAVEQLAGLMAKEAISSGEPIRESTLIDTKGLGYMAAILPSGMRAVATDISAESATAGFILPNDRVDVILSRRDREAERLTGIESQIAETLLSDVKVLAIDQNVEDKSGRPMVGRTATLELTPRQVETLAMGRLMGTLSLALRSVADSDPSKRGAAPPPDSGTTGRLNIVRFGVTTTTIPK